MKDLSALSLSELRVLYPSIKATSQARFLELVAELEQVKEVEVVAPEVVEVVTPEESATEESATEVVEDIKEYIKDSFEGEDIPEELLLEFIASQILTRNKVLVKCVDSNTADEYLIQCQYKLFPLLNDKGISVLVNSSRRDLHLNGTCYLRFAAAKDYDHLKQLMIYNTFKTIVK